MTFPQLIKYLPILTHLYPSFTNTKLPIAWLQLLWCSQRECFYEKYLLLLLSSNPMPNRSSDSISEGGNDIFSDWHLGEKSQLLILDRFISDNWCHSNIVLWLLYMSQGKRPALFQLAFSQHHLLVSTRLGNHCMFCELSSLPCQFKDCLFKLWRLPTRLFPPP